jgi:peptidoglycan/LPS O-acetylase OafA/YrhL
MSSHKTYYALLDLLRFFAAFWVMNFHYLARFGVAEGLSWYRYGNLGVQLFFIISGFVIVQSLEGKTLKEFAKGRFIRLFPLFWFLCTVTYILTLIFPHASHVSLGSYLMNMTMLPDVFIGFFHRGSLVDAAYWTLTVELLFYIGIGIFCWLSSYKNIRYFLAGWLLVSLAAFLFQVDQNFYVKLLLVRHASYFVFGSALALIVTKQAKNVYEKYFDKILLCAAVAFSLLINVKAIPAYLNTTPIDTKIVTGLIALFFVVVPILVYLSTLIKNPRVIRVLVVIGGLTYPLYLLHQRIGNVVMNYVTDRWNLPWNSFAIAFEVVIIIVAYIIYVQEKKVRAWLKRHLTL